MMNVGRRIGEGIGTVLAWGAAWFVAGIVVARVPGFDSDLPFALLFAPFGLVTGIIFYGILLAAGDRRRSDRMALARFAAWGAVSGLLPAVVVTALRGGRFEVLVFGPVLALAGAVCAGGSLAVLGRPETATPPGPGGRPTEA